MKRLLAIAAILAAVSFGDTITLRSGRTISGSYLGGDTRQIRMVVGERVESYAVSDVERIEFGSLQTSNAQPPAPVEAQPAAAPAAERGLITDRRPPASNPSYRGTQIPAGTTITVRMIDPVDSRSDTVGQKYQASLDEPIMINGEVVVPRGADIVAKLVNDQQSGRLTGQTVLTIDLESITIDGRVVPIATEEVSKASSSRTKKTGIATGGLAALGAVIGGIAGGGRGAAIGAVSGAGAGAAGSVLMKGERVQVPSETRLTFTLEQPLNL